MTCGDDELFCGMADRRKAFSLISRQDHCQRSSSLQISDTPWAGFEPAQNLISGLVEWSCVAVIPTTPLVHFHPTTQKSKNFTSMSYFCPKYLRFELQKYRRVIFHDTEQWCKIWINPDLVVSKMTWRIGWTFIRALKSLFLAKVYVSVGKLQRNYVSWHWRVLQNLKENWVVTGKMT